MKILIIFALLLVLTSCSSKITDRRFVTIKPLRDWEVTLTFNKDSSFIMKDDFCCNEFYYCGKWRYVTNSKNTIVLSDTIKAVFDDYHEAFKVYNRDKHYFQLYPPHYYFPIISNDTITIKKNGRKILFRDLKFERQTIFDRKNLSKTRALLIAHELVYTLKMPNKEFKSRFGKGKRQMLKAKTKELMICPDFIFPMKMHRKGS
ncbi:copper resistance protein NlpE [Chitinophaga sancti]|uniref:Copper resistance protein NlpE n=2 Tax=Chitinophaga sancti TaxID=1004 RepID=A0ABZ0XJG1_9BACT|nr:copper resistance protein NlpE [Chitinophaga sancti]WQD63627.1 copper resistance protein NlpE [Chitinophaga sancti]WQG90748.1 copper resistance protein NlpE [Chitinophaga sancti]